MIFRRTGSRALTSESCSSVQTLSLSSGHPADITNSTLPRINKSVMGSFSNMRNGMDILKQVLSQLLMMFSNFLDDLKTHCRDGAQLIKDGVTLNTLMTEVKKYTRTL